MTTEKVFIQIDNNRIELTGADLEAFESSRVEYGNAIKAEQAAKESAKAALLERLGITADEAALLLS
jgi:hypothetical protein